MTQPIDRASAEGFWPNTNSAHAPQSRPTWDSEPLREGTDTWRYVRRVELANLTTLFIIALIHGSDGALATDDAWRDDPTQRDREIVKRAVNLGRLLQDAVDRARPRA